MMLADVATVSTVVEVVELCRPMLPDLVYRSLLRFAEEADATLEEHADKLYDLEQERDEARQERDDAVSKLDDLHTLAACVRREYDLTDNEAARLLIHEIEEA